MRFAIAVVLAGCWTAPVAEPVADVTPPTKLVSHGQLEITLQRTMCFGACPAYTVTIRGDGLVKWTGHANVTAMGQRERRIPRAQLDGLAHMIDQVKFFDLDQYGRPKKENSCATIGQTTTCTFQSVTVCSDTSHAIVAVRRAGHVHKIDDAHCDDDVAAIPLEEMIDRIARTSEWIE